MSRAYLSLFRQLKGCFYDCQLFEDETNNLRKVLIFLMLSNSKKKNFDKTSH